MEGGREEGGASKAGWGGKGEGPQVRQDGLSGTIENILRDSLLDRCLGLNIEATFSARELRSPRKILREINWPSSVDLSSLFPPPPSLLTFTTLPSSSFFFGDDHHHSSAGAIAHSKRCFARGVGVQGSFEGGGASERWTSQGWMLGSKVTAKGECSLLPYIYLEERWSFKDSC